MDVPPVVRHDWNEHACVWSRDGSFEDTHAATGEYTSAPTSGKYYRHYFSELRATNQAGVTVGVLVLMETLFLSFLGDTEIDFAQAVVDMTPIFPGDALDINAAGHVVGSAYGPSILYHSDRTLKGLPRVEEHAVLWDGSDLRKLLEPGRRQTSEAVGINDHGQVAGNSSGHGLGGFRWHDGVFTGLGDFQTKAINNVGHIIGRVYRENLGVHDAAIWRGGEVERLPSLPGHTISDALGINDAGQIAGWSQDGDRLLTRRAVLWLNNQPKDLNSFLPRGSGWKLGLATDISNTGEVVGIGAHNQERSGFLMRLPREPVVRDT